MTEDEPDPSEVAGDPDELEFRYSWADSYRTYPSDGFRGGVQPNGNFQIDFYSDSFAPPAADVFELTDNGLGEFKRRDGDLAVNRVIQTGVKMSQRHAYELGAYLLSEVLGEVASEEDVRRVIEEEYSDSLQKQE